jgi:alkylation response protein AidB-like acyl-CoA dehydrogenase
MLVDVVTELATEVVRPAAAAADVACATPDDVLTAANEIGLPLLGVPETLGGISEERAVMAGALVAEALAAGDLGIAVATLAPGAVATAIATWGTDEQQQTYLPAFTGDGSAAQGGTGVPAAALALTEPRPLFDALAPATTARREGDDLVLDGVKSMVPRGADAELFVVGARLDGAGVLVIVEAGTDGLSVEADPSMGVRAASLTTLTLDGVRVPAANLLGSDDGTTYAECVRLSRLAWCALAVGVGQAVLDYVTPYVKERHAFGEPIARRQSVAFMVANIAIELQAMRLLTWKAASRAAAGKDVARDVALARKLCGDKGMQIGLDGVQLLGGHGFVKEHPVERWYRDLRAISIMEGGVLV